jgi:glycosyltransferase involved in cell wall biosynthesis
MKKRLLIADQSQFGYHVDTYKYSILLQRDYAISLICWDYGHKKLPEEDTRVVYISRAGNKIERLARYIAHTIREIRTEKHDLVLVVKFPFCSLIRWFNPNKRMMLFITSGYVGDNRVMKLINDGLLYCDSLFFRHVLVQSETLRRRLHIRQSKSYIASVGADEMTLQDKNFDSMHLFYVGTLRYRAIDKTVEGFARFYEYIKHSMEASYDIVGFGSPAEEKKLVETIRRTECEDKVRFYGRVPHNELRPFLDKNNIGVAFIPMVKHFDCQPATKVFEYLLSGMAVLATATRENQLVIHSGNGVLIRDDADGVFYGLMELYMNRGKYDSRMIKHDSAQYTWHNIICNGLRNYFDSIMDDRS